jgi:hypothetical protein
MCVSFLQYVQYDTENSINKNQKAHYISLLHQLAAPGINYESLAIDYWNLCRFSYTIYTSHYVKHDEKGTGSVARETGQDMKCQGCAVAQVPSHWPLTPEILVQSQVSPEICNGQTGSGIQLSQSTLVLPSVSFYWCPILIHLSLMLYNLSKWQVSFIKQCTKI